MIIAVRKRAALAARQLAIGLAAGMLFAAGTGAAGAAEVTMRLAHVFPPQHPLGRLATRYAEVVASETGGRVAVEVLGGGQAFAERESYPAVAKGQIEATLLVSVQFSGIVPTVDALSVPFLMTGPDSAARFLDSDARHVLDRDIRAKRVEPLAWLFQTDVSIFTSGARPIAGPADFAGLKIRGINRIIDAALSATGASPLATPGSEVYQALQAGVLDAALTDVSASVARRYYEVQRYGTVVPHVLTAYGILLANPDWVAKLPQDLRAGLARAATIVEAEGVAAGAANAAAAVAALKDHGVGLTLVADDALDLWKQAMTPAARAAYEERTGADGTAVLAAFDRLDGR